MLTTIAILVLLYCLFARSKKGDEFKVADGPKLTAEQQQENYRSMRRFIEAHPGLAINKQFPGYLEDIELTRRYNDLERRFKAGEVSYADYQIELNELIQKVRIDF